MSDKTFAERVKLMHGATRMMKLREIEVQGGHLVGQSLMLAVSVADFDRLVETSELTDISIKKTPPTDQITGHSTAVNEGALRSFPEVRVMAISITPAPAVAVAQVRTNPLAVDIGAYLPFDAERAAKREERKAELHEQGLKAHAKRLDREQAEAEAAAEEAERLEREQAEAAAEEDAWQPMPF
jgi:hypothetical protein